jgi:hypothetical protein
MVATISQSLLAAEVMLRRFNRSPGRSGDGPTWVFETVAVLRSPPKGARRPHNTLKQAARALPFLGGNLEINDTSS